MTECGNTKHACLFPFWRPITIYITGVIGDHLCVLCTRTCFSLKIDYKQSFALQVSLGIIFVFCVLTHVLSKSPFALHLRKNFIKSVLMKLSYLKIEGGERQKLALQFPLGIICVFYDLTHVLTSKAAFVFHF